MKNLRSSARCLQPSLLCVAQTKRQCDSGHRAVSFCVILLKFHIPLYYLKRSCTWAPPCSQLTDMFMKCGSGMTSLNTAQFGTLPSPDVGQLVISRLQTGDPLSGVVVIAAKKLFQPDHAWFGSSIRHKLVDQSCRPWLSRVS